MSELGLWVDENKFLIILVFLAVAMVFIVIGHKYRDKIQLVLKQDLAKFPESSIDWWSISHFVLFLICGLIIPGYPLTFFTIGVSFELIEDYLSSNENTLLENCNPPTKPNGEPKAWCKGLPDGYWYMNPTDPWVNLTGYIIGSAIRSTLINPSCSC